MAHYAKVILPIPEDDGFTYRIPENMVKKVVPGMQVIVPFNKKYVSGIVLSIDKEKPDTMDPTNIKEIYDVVYTMPIVSDELMQLLDWISTYYICKLGEAYRLIPIQLNVEASQLLIKRGFNKSSEKLAKSQQNILNSIPIEGEISLHLLRKKLKQQSLSQSLLKLEKSAYIERRYAAAQIKNPQKRMDFYQIVNERTGNTDQNENFEKILKGKVTKSQQLLMLLSNGLLYSAAQLRERGFSTKVLNRLVTLGMIKKQDLPIDRSFDLVYNEDPPEITLTDEQAEFVGRVGRNIHSGEFKIHLLHGITGSGKTQIYIELIKMVLSHNKQAIILIPEIVLTPQTVARFRAKFGDKVIALHSRITGGEKREILFKIRQGLFEVVVGPRSAIFAPVKNLGLIVVDEEHESSYKQTDSQPRYHARDVALYRARLNNAVVVLGSATPSFESLYNTKEGQFEYFQLLKRIEARKLPRVTIVDLREDWKKLQRQPIISNNLELKIESRLLFKEQIIILQNRRGYSPYILCKECGYVAKCKNCEITLTYHQKKWLLRCHYCDYQEKAPDVCPNCQGADLVYKGIGTQRLEEQLLKQFPHSKIIRMDQDTTRGKHGHAKILDKFRKREADILLGTQMIAKGLDFENVSLVGIVAADQGLHFPDFRASEKTVQLLTQAAGRAGRGHQSGEVVVQTYDPSYYIFEYLLSHNYHNFFNKEIESRRYLNYPPFSRLILIKIEGKNLAEVEHYSEVIGRFLWKSNHPKFFIILGPSPAQIPKIKNMYRYHILLKQDKKVDFAMSRLRHLIRRSLYLNDDLKKWPVKVFFDVDPIEIL